MSYLECAGPGRERESLLAFEKQQQEVEERLGLVFESTQYLQCQPSVDPTHNKSLLIWQEDQVNASWEMEDTGHQMKAGEVVMSV